MFNQDLYQEAAEFAATAHRDQTWYGADGQTLSYVLHFTGVAAEVIASLAAEPTEHGDLAVTCALLHDTVEDTSVTLEDVERRFGSAVRHGVAALTKEEGSSGDKRVAMEDSLERIQAQPHEVWRVKLADRIMNLGPPAPHWDDAKCRQYGEEAGVILEALGQASPFLAARLAQKIEHYPPRRESA
jgi:(p)ppGpp synthase/HD superfamily hydrolase